jgi:hypothetical protein
MVEVWVGLAAKAGARSHRMAMGPAKRVQARVREVAVVLMRAMMMLARVAVVVAAAVAAAAVVLEARGTALSSSHHLAALTPLCWCQWPLPQPQHA